MLYNTTCIYIYIYIIGLPPLCLCSACFWPSPALGLDGEYAHWRVSKRGAFAAITWAPPTHICHLPTNRRKPLSGVMLLLPLNPRGLTFTKKSLARLRQNRLCLSRTCLIVHLGGGKCPMEVLHAHRRCRRPCLLPVCRLCVMEYTSIVNLAMVLLKLNCWSRRRRLRPIVHVLKVRTNSLLTCQRKPF